MFSFVSDYITGIVFVNHFFGRALNFPESCIVIDNPTFGSRVCAGSQMDVTFALQKYNSRAISRKLQV